MSHAERMPAGERGRLRRVVLSLLVGALALFLLPGTSDAAKKRKKKVNAEVTVETRNIYLGTDLGPALASTNFQEFIEANGEILRNVDLTNFPERSFGLAAEIFKNKPDLIGLQEVALWRTGPADLNAPVDGPRATAVKYDFLQILLSRLNGDKQRYRVAVVKPEFDFEAPADYDDNPGTGLLGGEINGRLTMRDVILVRIGKKVKTAKPRTGTYSNLFTPTVSGLSIPVTRGWTALDAKVRGGRWFRFVNTHFEAFDDETERPSTRAKQAMELTGPNGPTVGKKPVIALGDFNSDSPGVKPGDEQGFDVLLSAGFTNRDTRVPLSCCVNSFDMRLDGDVSEFDHKVDHVLSNSKLVKKLSSVVVGRERIATGFWPSDHAGIVSKLRVKPPKAKLKKKKKGKKRGKRKKR